MTFVFIDTPRNKSVDFLVGANDKAFDGSM
jgi:hypothetical protein